MKAKWKESLQLFWGQPFIICLVLFLLDQWTKLLILDWYQEKGEVYYPVINGFLNIVYVTNKGAAWGILSEYTVILAFISFVAGVYILLNFKELVGDLYLYRILGGLLLAGIFGNFIDRAFREEGVIDMVDVVFGNWHYPAFNVADACIFMSVLIYFIHSSFFNRKKSSPIDENS